MTEHSQEIKPPRVTASCSLIIVTVLVLIGIVCLYFLWYKQKPLTKIELVTEKKIKLTDLARSIQDAKPNTVILVEPGEVREQYKISGKNDIVLKSLKKGEAVIVENGPLFIIENCRRCTIEGFQLKAEESEEPGVLITNSKEISLVSNTIQGGRIGIKAHANPEVLRIIQNTINVSHCGIEVQEGKEIFVEKNNFTLAKKTKEGYKVALKFNQVTGISLDKNDLSNGGVKLDKVYPFASEKHSVFSNNKVETQEGPGLSVLSSQSLQIVNNEINIQGGIAVVVQDCEDLSLEKNMVKAVRGTALTLSGRRDIKFQENTFLSGLKKKPTLIIKNTDYLKFTDNKIYGTVKRDETGIKILDLMGGGVLIEWAKELDWTDNEIKYSDSHGISIFNSQNVKLTKNNIKDNFVNSGIAISDSTDFIISGNSLEGNYDGIRIQSSQGKVEKNVIKNNRAHGIWIEASSPSILDNEIQNNEYNGIECIRCQPKVEGNSFVKNKGFGINYSQHIDSPPLTLNSFKDNGRGPVNNP